MNAVPTLLEFAPKVLDRREAEGIRGIVSERNRYDQHIVSSELATMRLDEIRPRHLRHWVANMQQKRANDTRGERKISTDTVKRAYALVSAILGAAVDDDLIEDAPRAGKIKRRLDEFGKADPWTFLSLAEQLAINACTDIPIEHRLAIAFAIGCGARQGEQFNMEWRDVHDDLADPYVFIRWGSAGKPPKNGKTREVPILPHVRETLRQWRELAPFWAPENPLDLVFPGKTGRRRGVGKPLGRGGLLKKYLALVGVTRRVRWHDLRHTFGSALVSGMWDRDWSLEEIRPIIGHSTIAMTNRYAHVCKTKLAEAARKTNYGGFVAPTIPPVPDTNLDLAIPPANDTAQDLGCWLDDEAVAS